MTDDTQMSNLGLEKLLIQMEANLSKRMGHVEDNVEKRMDKFESTMEQYVLKEVFHIEMVNLRNELYAAKRAAEEKQKSMAQRFTWGIAIVAVIASIANYFVG